MKNEMKKKVTVIVAVYNAENYLEKCLDSILNQDYTNLEIILVNDGSKDRSKEIIDAYCLKDERIIAIHKENNGQGSAFNVGVDTMTGDYVCFVDNDDWVDRDYVSFMYEKLDGSEYDFVECCSKDFEEETGQMVEGKVRQDYVFTPEEGIRDLLSDHKFVAEAMSCKLYRRELFDNIRLEEGKNYQDTATFFKMMPICKKIAFFHDAKYNYLIRTGSITHSGYTKNSVQQVEMYTDHHQLVETYYKESLPLLEHYIVSVAMSNYIKMVVEGKEELYKEDKELYFKLFKMYKPLFEWNTTKLGLWVLWNLFRIRPSLLRRVLWRYRKKAGAMVNAVVVD